VYDQYFITLYNIVYTSLPVLAMGVFDQVWMGKFDEQAGWGEESYCKRVLN
jgi:magnesium-transporting ATPase (P-type)